MTKIKIVGAVVFSISITLTLLFVYINKQTKINSDLLNTINLQKAFTQEISKNIFYSYKDKNISKKQLDDSIKIFLNQLNHKDENFSKISCEKIDNQNKKIVKLWNYFYFCVQQFKDYSKIKTPYSNLLIEKTVKDIYNTNFLLITEFNELIKIHESYFSKKLNIYKNIEYTLSLLLLVLLMYLFTQIKTVMVFIQKFLSTSKNIIKKSSIKELEYIEIKNNSSYVFQATNNFNKIVERINLSLNHSSSSIEQSHELLKVLEKNIEDLLELFDTMEEDSNVDKELTKKEDALIESLEALSSCTQKLKDVKINLNKLISH